MEPYDHNAIEKKWQDAWAKDGLYTTDAATEKPTCYVLDMFPYPSGEGLHVGHPKGYIATDIYSRFKRAQGFEILHPMGWDAFGLPAENFAIKNKVHPRVAVDKNIANFKHQLSILGFNYDWSREINTTDPAFYKWTQWIFLKLYERGLAYQSNEPINWCPSCQTGLANEDLTSDGTCERCDSKVEKRPIPQWVLKITDYADRMLADLDTLTEWPLHIKEAQRNWIGRNEGVEVDFHVDGSDARITVFTTRVDTILGVAFVVLAPEHPLVAALQYQNKNEVLEYVEQARTKEEKERTNHERTKTGVVLQGVSATNPATGAAVPLYVADYVLGTYGTGAVMGVPAHDERDREFAAVFDIEIPESPLLSYEEASTKTRARKTVTYKIQDWVFSRQRYWGEPIPIIHCEKCGAVPVPEAELPVLLPDVEHYEPTGTGESPLAAIAEWVNVTCPTCGGPGKRETNTMPQWAGSSWYWLRFMDPTNSRALVDPGIEKKWGPVDVYVGGDHAVRHLIYARFWHKFLYDIGVVSTEEPFTRLEFLGFVLAEDGRKMSKRWGNVINPDDIVAQVGADSMRVYEMFMGPFENTVPWSTNGLVGARRFLERVWRVAENVSEIDIGSVEASLHQTIKKVSEDIEAFKFNTAVSQMMIFINEVERASSIGRAQYEVFLKLLAPFAPHLAEELWHHLGNSASIHREDWPQYDPAKALSDSAEVAVQVGGKTRGSVVVSRDATEEVVISAVRGDEKLSKYLDFEPKKVVFVPNKIINFIP